MTNIRKLLAQNLRKYRTDKGLSQVVLAKKAKTAAHYILMIENARSWPTPEVIERLAAALEIDSAQLFALTPLADDWKEEVLKTVGEAIDKKLEGMRGIPKAEEEDFAPANIDTSAWKFNREEANER
jgi:transcriptional regulator with XRE-family HTH domain